MRRRPAARLLVINEKGELLLFRFKFLAGALSGVNFWVTPGGGIDPGESFEEAAKRELFEETGISIDSPGEHVAEREFVFTLVNGEEVLATERFFLVHTTNPLLTTDHWTDEERQFIQEHKWWRVDELSAIEETVYPNDLVEMLAQLRV